MFGRGRRPVAGFALGSPVALQVTTRTDAGERTVRDGEVDLFIGPVVREFDGIVAQTLYEDQLVVVMRRRHALARGELTLGALLVQTTAFGLIDGPQEYI